MEHQAAVARQQAAGTPGMPQPGAIIKQVLSAGNELRSTPVGQQAAGALQAIHSRLRGRARTAAVLGVPAEAAVEALEVGAQDERLPRGQRLGGLAARHQRGQRGRQVCSIQAQRVYGRRPPCAAGGLSSSRAEAGVCVHGFVLGGRSVDLWCSFSAVRPGAAGMSAALRHAAVLSGTQPAQVPPLSSPTATPCNLLIRASQIELRSMQPTPSCSGQRRQAAQAPAEVHAHSGALVYTEALLQWSRVGAATTAGSAMTACSSIPLLPLTSQGERDC